MTIHMDAALRVKTLIALTEELTAIFDSENASLTVRRPSEIAPLQEDKARLAAAYAQSIRDIAADRSLVNGAGDALMEKLKAITEVFEKRATEQRALLDGARLAAEGVLRAVAAEAGSARANPAYAGPKEMAAATRAAAIAFNEQA
jgi:hypothetical protein